MPDSHGYLVSEDGIFRGRKSFIGLLKRHLLKPGQLIRIYNYGTDSGHERLIALGLEEKLYENREPVNLDVLDGLDGYDFEGGFGLELLPDEIALKIIRSQRTENL